MLMYFHCLDADKLWFMLVDPQALIWFGDSTWIVLSYGSKMVDWYQYYLCSIQIMSSRHQVTPNFAVE